MLHLHTIHFISGHTLPCYRFHKWISVSHSLFSCRMDWIILYNECKSKTHCKEYISPLWDKFNKKKMCSHTIYMFLMLTSQAALKSYEQIWMWQNMACCNGSLTRPLKHVLTNAAFTNCTPRPLTFCLQLSSKVLFVELLRHDGISEFKP